MSHFLRDTIRDIRDGRETWRVFLACCAPALAAAIVLVIH